MIRTRLCALTLVACLGACGQETQSPETRRAEEFQILQQQVRAVEDEYRRLDRALRAAGAESLPGRPYRSEEWDRACTRTDRTFQSLRSLTLRDQDLVELRALRKDLRRQVEEIREPARALERDWIFVDVFQGQAVHTGCGGEVHYGAPCASCGQIGNPGYSCCPKISGGRESVCSRCGLRRPKAAIGAYVD